MNRFGSDYVPVTTGTTAVKHPSKFSIPSLLAIGAAILSLFVSAGWGFFLALAAIGFGLLGVLLALSPRVRGGVVSIVSVLAGGLGVVIALLRLLF